MVIKDTRTIASQKIPKILVIFAVALTALTLMPSTVFADWNFHPECTAEESTVPDEPNPPNIFLMLDQSGSMGDLEDDHGNTLWEVAVEGYEDDNGIWREGAIPWVTNALDEDIRFGLGYFPAEITQCTIMEDTIVVVCGTVCDFSGCWEECGYYLTEYEMCPQPGGFECDIYPVDATVTEFLWGYDWGWEGEELELELDRCTFRGEEADEIVVSDYENASTIQSELDDTFPTGGTPTWNAIREIRESESMNQVDYLSAGVLITDGNPCCHETARDDAIDEACTSRQENDLTYVLGLGGETDQDFNNKMAAALGTGSCDDGDPCTQSGVDPESCEGALHADNRTELQNQLLEIGGTFQCTFPVDTSMHPDPEETDAIDVEMVHNLNPEMTVPHREDSGDSQGWYFADEDETYITLTDDYCNEIGDGRVDEVTTRVGCVCGDPDGINREDGDPCTVPDPQPGECPEGTVECSDGYAQCNPLPIEDCPLECDAIAENLPCHVDDFDLTLQEILDGADPSLDLVGERNRCKVGRITCDDVDDGASEVPNCSQALEPMPELCDGLDNSCSGSLDDISPSWDAWDAGEGSFEDSAWEGVTMSDLEDADIFEEDWQSPSCHERSLCSCEGPGLEGPRSDHVGVGVNYGDVIDEFEDYLDGWSPDYCQCSSEIRRNRGTWFRR